MTTSSSSARLFVVAAMASLLVVRPAFADPSAADLESARELFKEARALREKGDVKGALDRFKAAHAYGQTPVTALELGRTHMQLGELVEAREVLLSVARIKVASDETDKSSGARAEAAELAEQIRPRIPTLVVKVSGVPASPAPTVTVDGASLPVVALVATRKINPGSHVVVVSASQREEKRTVDLKEGQTQELAVDLAGKPAETQASAAPATPPAADAAGERKISPVVWIGLGVGVVGLGVGTVTGIIASGKAGDVKDACQGTRCPASARDDVDAGRSAATISTVGFVVGAAGLAAAAVGWFVLSKPEKAAHVSGVRVALDAGGIHGAF